MSYRRIAIAALAAGCAAAGPAAAAGPGTSGGTPPTPAPSPAAPKPVVRGPLVAQLSSRAVQFDGPHPARLVYGVGGGAPVDLRVDLVRVRDGALVARWGPRVAAPYTPLVARWNGLTGGRVPADGRYRFDVFAGAAATPPSVLAGARPAAAAPPALSDSFDFRGHVFPIRGRHDYGVAVNRFGPVSGRGHRGQDVLAACGTPLVAARGGRVTVNASQSAAGNYVVIAETGSRRQHAYMHLRERSPVPAGARVRTGQRIGHVGDTGNSTACHLHFEVWEGPWWGGGRPVDPLPLLRAWDRR